MVIALIILMILTMGFVGVMVKADLVQRAIEDTELPQDCKCHACGPKPSLEVKNDE